MSSLYVIQVECSILRINHLFQNGRALLKCRIFILLQYLQIALILSIENPLPRGVVDKAENTNPEVRGIEPPLKHLHKSKNEFKQSLL